MRPLPLALLALVLAGCAAPQEAPPVEDGPVDLTGRLGLLLVDVETGAVEVLTERSGLGWMSPNATFIAWTEETFAIVLDRSSGAREVAPPVAWARIHDNGIGLELAEREARVRYLVNGTVAGALPLRPAPPEGPWTAASDDLTILGSEHARGRPSPCANDIAILDERLERTIGCHLRIASDGRAGWTEGTGVRVRTAEGEVRNLTGAGSGNVANNTFAGHENPLFTADGVVMLRLTGGTALARSEIVDEEGQVLAKMEGTRRLALQDVSADGRYVLVRAFDR